MTVTPLPAPAPDTIALPVRIRSQDGRSGGAGEIRYAEPSLGQRLRKAGVLLLAGVAAVFVFLPVPLMHFVGVIIFLILSGVALRRLGSRQVLKAARGRCPACGVEGSFYTGFGNQRLVFPITTSCTACHVGLQLERESAATIPG